MSSAHDHNTVWLEIWKSGQALAHQYHKSICAQYCPDDSLLLHTRSTVYQLPLVYLECSPCLAWKKGHFSVCVCVCGDWHFTQLNSFLCKIKHKNVFFSLVLRNDLKSLIRIVSSTLYSLSCILPAVRISLVLSLSELLML